MLRFSDGDVRFFVYDQCSCVALPALFPDYGFAGENCRNSKAHEAAWQICRNVGPGEVAAVFTWWSPNQPEAPVDFYTRADRAKAVIVGPLRVDSAYAEFGDGHCPEGLVGAAAWPVPDFSMVGVDAQTGRTML
jgi:hypothetical protein